MKNLLLPCLFLIPCLLKAQGWERTFPIVAGIYSTNELRVLDNEKIVMMGSKSESIFGPDSIFIIQTDPKGNIEWERSYSFSTLSNHGHCMAIAPGGSYMIAGSIEKPFPQDYTNLLLFRLDSLGQLLWSKDFDFNFDAVATAIFQQNGHYFIAGSVEDITGEPLVLLMKLDEAGEVIWQKTYPMLGAPAWPSDLTQTIDGGWALAGNNHGTFDSFILKTDGDGNQEWIKEYPMEFNAISDFIQTFDGGYILAGANADFPNFKLMQVNSIGEKRWTKILEKPFDGSARSVVQNNHGNIVATGYYKDGDINDISIYFLLTELDKNGQTVWEHYYTEDIGGFGTKLANLPDNNGYILTGRMAEPDLLFLAKTDREGNTFPNLLHGNVFHDKNNNCNMDADDFGLEGWHLEVDGPIQRYTNTDAWGDYRFNLDTGNYELHIYPPSPYWFPCPSTYAFSFPMDFDTVVMDVPVQSFVDCPMMEVSLSAFSLRRCFDNYYYVQYCNTGTLDAENAHVQVTLDSLLIYVDASITATQISSNTNDFELGTVAVGECGSFYIILNVDCNADLELEQCVEAHIFPDTLCISETPYYPIINECRNIMGSFDPNDKNCFVNGHLENAIVKPNTSLEYQIRFQNTGNDTAFTVVIRDTLPKTLDIISVSPGASSHPYTFELYGDGILKFTFRDIMLPDSNINEQASHGFIKFRVEQVPNLSNNTLIQNNAGIYFDYNAPIITNTHTLVIRGANATDETSFRPIASSILPNPFFKTTTISIVAPQDESYTLCLFDALGEKVLLQQVKAPIQQLALDDIPAGLYFYQLQQNGQIKSAGKMVKQ